MSKMEKPFVFVKMNQCPHCLGKLELVEEETYVGALDSKGIPIGGQSFIELQLRCRKCGQEYPASKKGAHYYITPIYGNSQPVMKDYNPFYV